MSKRVLLLLAVIGGVLIAAAAASATSSLFGGATTSGSDVVLTSDLTNASTADDASGISFTLPAGTTFAGLTQLSTSFDPIVGGCGGGSPRFTIHLASGKNVFVYLGPSPNFTGCALNIWQSSGNLIGNNDIGRYDTSQVQAGTQSNTYAGALALVGSQQVTGVDLVVDSGWFFDPKVQTVLVHNVDVNGQTAATGGRSANAAQLCRAEENALGKDAFEHKWGTNHNLKNAFGKCVSKMAHQRNAH
jgi:hypothetical protein